MVNNNTIEHMLRNGATPNDIMNMVREAQNKINLEERQKATNAAIIEARNKIINDFSAYMELIGCAPEDAGEQKAFSEICNACFDDIEKTVKQQKHITDVTNDILKGFAKSNKPDTDSKEVAEKLASDDEILKRFLKDLFNV